MYTLILLDADNTLFDFDKAESIGFSEIFRQKGYEGNLDAIKETYEKINIQLWRQLEEGKLDKDVLKVKRFMDLVEACDLPYDGKELSANYIKELGKGYYLLDGAKELCQTLSKKYRLAIVTNGIEEVQLSRLAGSTIKDYIDEIIISEAVGVNKPDPYIFDYTLKKLGHQDKEDVLMIGDSLTSDIQGGLNAGIDTCWFNRNGKSPNIKGIRPKYTIHKLDELYSLL